MNEKAAAALKNWYSPEKRVLFITGAGLSVDSGLPTYRGVAGLYDNADTEDGVPIEVALSGNMYRRNPELTWKYLMQIADACKGKSFNRGHQLIAESEKYFGEVWVLTQNIDGFHKKAESSNVIEIHGTMQRMVCESCTEVIETPDLNSTITIPECPECQTSMRPAVVLFGEMLPDAAIADYQRELDKGFDGIFIVGTSAVFPYISGPIQMAAGTDCLTVEINPTSTDLSDIVDIKLDCGATEGLELIVEMVGKDG